MKKLITIITVVISLNTFAQKKDTTAPKIDSASIPILSINDINNYMQQLSKSTVLSPDEFSKLMQIFSQMVATKQKELQTNGSKK